MFQIECIMSIYDNNIYISVNISSHNLISGVNKFSATGRDECYSGVYHVHDRH